MAPVILTDYCDKHVVKTFLSLIPVINCNKREGELVQDGIFSVASQNFIQGLPANLLCSLITQAFFVRLLPPSSFL